MHHLNEIPVYKLTLGLDREPVFIAISTDYEGHILEKDIYISLCLDQKYFYFATESELFSPPSKDDYGYKEGLWESEVSELFIYDSICTDYQEFNISPSGAVWGMNFSRYRERTNRIEGLSYISKDQAFILKIPIESLRSDLESNTVLLHIAGVIRDKDGKETLYSSRPLKNSRPDFHRRESGLRHKIL